MGLQYYRAIMPNFDLLSETRSIPRQSFTAKLKKWVYTRSDQRFIHSIHSTQQQWIFYNTHPPHTPPPPLLYNQKQIYEASTPLHSQKKVPKGFLCPLYRTTIKGSTSHSEEPFLVPYISCRTFIGSSKGSIQRTKKVPRKPFSESVPSRKKHEITVSNSGERVYQIRSSY